MDKQKENSYSRKLMIIFFFFNSLVTWHLAIRLNAVFQAVELPAGIADLDTSLANVDGDALTHNGDLYGSAGLEQGRGRPRRSPTDRLLRSPGEK